MNMLKSDLIKQIKRYQNYITSTDPSEDDTPKVLHYIRKLAKLPIRLAELEETGIGKTVNGLRKRNGNIGEEATLLVAKWKSIVKKQVADEERGDDEEEEETEDELDQKEILNKESQSNHVPERDSCSDDVQRTSKYKLKKEENEVKCEQILDVKATHLITLKNKNKRKHSDQSDSGEKKKVMRMHYKSIVESGPSRVQSKKDSADVSPDKPNIESSHSDADDSDLEKSERKRSSNEDKKRKKGHEKRHKTSRHNHKNDRHHRHHSKSSQQEKKRDGENGETSQKRRRDGDSRHGKDSHHDRDSKSKSKSESRKHHKKQESDMKKTSSLIESETNEKKIIKTEVASTEDHVDSTTGDDLFGAALLNIPHTISPNKKRSTSSKSSTYQDSLHSPSSQKSIANFDMFSTNVSLEPLDFTDDLKDTDFYSSPNSYSQTKLAPNQSTSDEAMLNSMVVTKNQKTRVYSGNKCSITNVPTLFDLCVRLLQENFDALEFTGGVPYHLLKPILEKVSVQQLFTFENYNPYLIGETDELWKYHVKKDFRKAERPENETWRDVYLDCVEKREEKLGEVREKISKTIAESTPVRKTQLAYINTFVKPPRNVARSQVKHGTGSVNVLSKMASPTPTQSVKERLSKEAMSPNAIKVPTKSNLLVKKKKAPLMLKSLQLMKTYKR